MWLGQALTSIHWMTPVAMYLLRPKASNMARCDSSAETCDLTTYSSADEDGPYRALSAGESAGRDSTQADKKGHKWRSRLTVLERVGVRGDVPGVILPVLRDGPELVRRHGLLQAVHRQDRCTRRGLGVEAPCAAEAVAAIVDRDRVRGLVIVVGRNPCIGPRHLSRYQRAHIKDATT